MASLKKKKSSSQKIIMEAFGEKEQKSNLSTRLCLSVHVLPRAKCIQTGCIGARIKPQMQDRDNFCLDINAERQWKKFVNSHIDLTIIEIHVMCGPEQI